ncbi:SusC/RagA family TonB-linked outer membrane protein [Chitinophagaceae bacterium LWZ2-11]
MRKVLLFFAMVMGLLTATIAQTKSVSGTVTDKDGKPIEGASIQIQGKRSGATTDSKGSFQITSKEGDVLVISAMNFSSTKVKVGSQSSIAASLIKSDVQLSEVVVTALGIKRSKNSLPYSTQQVSAEDLNKVASTNVVNNLSGKVAGLQITQSNTMGGSTNAILRGFKSLTQSNQALFVIDGVPFDNTNQSRSSLDLGNSASDINPDDVESVTVLKGPSASALYGSRGANGVILITTKKGSHKGRGVGVVVNVGVQVATPDKSTLPEYQTDYGQGYGSAGYSAAYPAQSGFFYYTPTFNSGGQRVNVVQTDVDAATGPAYNKNLLVYNWDAFSPTDPNYGKATPWMPAAHYKPTDFFQTPLTSIASIYIDGGGEQGNFKLGYTNSYDKGLMPNSSIQKNQLNFGATYNVTDKWTVGGTINYVSELAVNRNAYAYGGGGAMRDFRQWWPTNVDIQAQKNDFFNSGMSNASWNWLGGYTTNAPGNIVKPAYHNNLYWDAYKNYNNDSRYRYFGNINTNYKFTSYLSLMGRVSMDNYDQMSETRSDVGSVGTPSYSRFNSTFNETNYDLMLNFDKNVINDLNVRAVVGGNIRQTQTSSISGATNGGLVVPGFFALSNSVKTPNAPTEGYSVKQVDGIFGNLTLTWKQMVTLDGTIRRDQSSTLPKGNNVYYYPSVSGNFVFSKLLPEADWLSYGKLRATYAEVGNDAPVFSLQNTYSAGTPFNSQTVFSSPTTNNNPNLKPESNKSYEFGLEASFLKGRVGFDVTYYHSLLENQIMPITPSNSTGFTSFYVNGGTVQNSGVELMINATPVKTKSFSWNIALNWARNRSKVLSLYGGQKSYIVGGLQNAIQIVAEVGQQYGVIRGTDYQYLNGQRLIDAATGLPMIATNAKSDIGTINPDWIGGINNSFRYKNVALSFLVDVKQGGNVYSLDMDYGSSSGLYPQNAGKNSLGNPVRSPLAAGGGYVYKGVTPDGKPNTVRADESDINAGNYSFSSSLATSTLGESAKEYLYDASYVKLREVALTYSIPAKAIAKLSFIKGIDVSLTGRNLWIIHKNMPYSDPEQGQASGNASIGYQNGAFPSLRTFGCNLKFKF